MLLVAVAVGALTMGLLAVVRPAAPTRLPSVLVPLAAAGGAVALGLADAAPTGWQPLDLLLRAGFGALVPVVAARAGTVSTNWFLLVAIATLFVALDAPGALVAGVAAGAFWALWAAGVTAPPFAAVATAAGLGALAHVDWPVATGASALAVALASLPLLVAGLAASSQPRRRRILVGLCVVAVVLGLGAAAGLAAALSARSEVDAAVEAAMAGIGLLGDDDDRARTKLHEAAGAFASAEDDLTVWWARPALLVPGVAQQARAVGTMASAGADLARTAADASAEADLESVRPRGGRIDLDAVAELEEPLARSVRSLRSADERLAEVDSPLLLAPVASRLGTLRTEVDDALGSAELAADAVEVAPAMLGSDGVRRYFVSFQNPAEQRGNGGFMGNWAELTARDGALTLTRSGRLDDLRERHDTTVDIQGEQEIQRVYGVASRAWGLVNFSPDNPSVSRMIAKLYPISGGAEIDGVLTMTPAAISRFLELTGPVQVAGYPEALTPGNVERIMLHEQYLEFPQESVEQRTAFLEAAVENVFDRLLSMELPSPSVITDELGPAVGSRDLQLWSRHPPEQGLFDRIGATGDVSRQGVDSFGVVTQNYNGNKIDWFLHRDISYAATYDPRSGEVSGTLRVAIENRAPATGLPQSVIGWGGTESTGQRPVEDGENFMRVALYSTFPVERVRIDGEEVPFEAVEELGHHTARLFLSVPPRGRRVVIADVAGEVVPDSHYVVRAFRQPAAQPDTIEAVLSVPAQWRLSVGENPRGSGVREVRHRFAPDGAGPLEAEITRAEGRDRSLLERLRGDHSAHRPAGNPGL